MLGDGKPQRNGFVEISNGRLRDKRLIEEVFAGLAEACDVVERWRLDNNFFRAHSAQGGQTPDAVRKAPWPARSATLTAPPADTVGDRHLLSAQAALTMSKGPEGSRSLDGPPLFVVAHPW